MGQSVRAPSLRSGVCGRARAASAFGDYFWGDAHPRRSFSPFFFGGFADRLCRLGLCNKASSRWSTAKTMRPPAWCQQLVKAAAPAQRSALPSAATLRSRPPLRSTRDSGGASGRSNLRSTSLARARSAFDAVQKACAGRRRWPWFSSLTRGPRWLKARKPAAACKRNLFDARPLFRLTPRPPCARAGSVVLVSPKQVGANLLGTARMKRCESWLAPESVRSSP